MQHGLPSDGTPLVPQAGDASASLHAGTPDNVNVSLGTPTPGSMVAEDVTIQPCNSAQHFFVTDLAMTAPQGAEIANMQALGAAPQAVPGPTGQQQFCCSTPAHAGAQHAHAGAQVPGCLPQGGAQAYWGNGYTPMPMHTPPWAQQQPPQLCSSGMPPPSIAGPSSAPYSHAQPPNTSYGNTPFYPYAHAPAPAAGWSHHDATWGDRNLYGLLITFGRGAVAHATKKLSLVLDSSMEAESIASSKAGESITYAREILDCCNVAK